MPRTPIHPILSHHHQICSTPHPEAATANASTSNAQHHVKAKPKWHASGSLRVRRKTVSWKTLCCVCTGSRHATNPMQYCTRRVLTNSPTSLNTSQNLSLLSTRLRHSCSCHSIPSPGCNITACPSTSFCRTIPHRPLRLLSPTCQVQRMCLLHAAQSPLT